MVYERNYITDAVQLMIFICDIEGAVSLHEEIASLCSLNGTMTGKRLFLKVKETFASLELGWEK
jgi:hypothetical protein